MQYTQEHLFLRYISCYHLRWGIETSFRDLKHTKGAIHLHSKKTEFVALELWSRLILYNFCFS